LSIPPVLLYTAGWSFNFKKSKFERTGSLLINTATPDVTLSLNDTIVDTGNEFRIKNVLPGEYSIKLSKNGYFNWQKKLEVMSELTTFVKNTRLFKMPAVISADKDVRGFFSSPLKNRIVYVKDEENKKLAAMWLIDSASDGPQRIAEAPYPVKNISWSANGEKIIAETGQGLKIYDVKTGQIKLPFLDGAIGAKWDNTNSLILYIQKTDGIYKFDFLFDAPEKIHPAQPSINDFAFADGFLYTVKQQTLKQTDGNETISLPLERKDYKIKTIIDKKLYLVDEASQKIQIFDLPLQKLSTPTLIANAKSFDASGDNLLFYNDFELWTYHFPTGAKELLTRFGKNIKKAAWINDGSGIIFSLDGEIKIIELDKRDKRQTTDIIQLKALDDFMLTKKYGFYIFGGTEKSDEIFKTDI
jgi:dipeptidyl aminopeptidase/acylaminoacyl peptidase